MGFLSAILPGLRDLRTPLLVGYTYLLAAWFASNGGKAVVASTGRVGELMVPLQDAFGPVFTAGGLSVVAYLLGSLVTRDERLRSSRAGVLFQRIWINMRNLRLLSEPVMRLRLLVFKYGFNQTDAWRLVRYELGQDMAEPLRPEFKADDGVDWAVSNRTFMTSVEATLERFDEEALSVRLQISRENLWNRYDQVSSEGHLRVSMALPVAALSLATAYRGQQAELLVGVGAALALQFSGSKRLRTARGMLVQALVTDTVADPAFAGAAARAAETLNEEIADVELLSRATDEEFTAAQAELSQVSDLPLEDPDRKRMQQIVNGLDTRRAELSDKLSRLRAQADRLKR